MTTRRKRTALPNSVRRLFPEVTVCRDASKAVFITVNRRDCKAGKRLRQSECALAVATKRELHVDGVIIGMASSYIIKGNEAVRFDTPERVRREIVSFDRHQDFAPGDYMLVPKSPAQRLGSHSGTQSGSRSKSTRVVHRTARVRTAQD